jgi:hypothetical protein
MFLVFILLEDCFSALQSSNSTGGKGRFVQNRPIISREVENQEGNKKGVHQEQAYHEMCHFCHEKGR